MKNRIQLFKPGHMVATRGALEMHTHAELSELVIRHMHGDWGDLGEADKQANEEALVTGARIFSAYGRGQGKLWVITEADRSVTTILRPDEY